MRRSCSPRDRERPTVTDPGADREGADGEQSLYSRQSRSRRRLTPWRRALYRLAAPLAIGIVRLWWASLRTR